MGEVNDIAKAAAYNVADQVRQHREAVDSAYCMGEGVLEDGSQRTGSYAEDCRKTRYVTLELILHVN